MPTIYQIAIPFEALRSDADFRKAVAKLCTLAADDQIQIIKKSIDARNRQIKFNLKIAIYGASESIQPLWHERKRESVHSAKQVIVIGAGPAGLFAALRLIEHNLKPIIIERGKDVQARRRDLATLNRDQIVNPESNYCFGEGGAGTYSDGKLYTRSTKRGDVTSILETLVQFGASEDILVEAHPHIGTNKLPKIIAAMREEIIAKGGEVHFNSKMTDIIVENNKAVGVETTTGEFRGVAVILATGHSARDVYQLFHDKKWDIEFKPFALGVRAEHPQSLIDGVQYHCEVRDELLPAAAYSLVEQVEGRGVYSFCMCPGGIIAPCSTAQEEIVTNGWSPSKRNNPFANSGVVVPIHWEDIPEFHNFGALAGLEFQKSVEKACWEAGGKTQQAPAQRMVDFVQNKKSNSLPECSYQPGIVSVNLHNVLPKFVAKSLQQGFIGFGKKMRGYLTNDAVLVATESRTSSPVRIPRDKETMQHTQLERLYPCAEGAGFAGGIVSAAIDGEKVADKIAELVLAM